MLKMNKFKRIYDLFQRRKINILLIQKFEIIRELQVYFQKTFSLISIAAYYVDNLNRINMKRDIVMIINNKTTVWNQKDDQGHKIFHNEDERLLICKIICRDQSITIKCIYVLIRDEKRASWFVQINKKLKSFSLNFLCDVMRRD